MMLGALGSVYDVNRMAACFVILSLALLWAVVQLPMVSAVGRPAHT